MLRHVLSELLEKMGSQSDVGDDASSDDSMPELVPSTVDVDYDSNEDSMPELVTWPQPPDPWPMRLLRPSHGRS